MFRYLITKTRRNLSKPYTLIEYECIRCRTKDEAKALLKQYQPNAQVWIRADKKRRVF